jgi:hypothetical protein
LSTQSRSRPRATSISTGYSPRQSSEQKSIGDDQLAVPERRQDHLLRAMAEVGAVEQRELLGAERAQRLAALDDRFDQVRRVPLRRDDVVPLGFQPGLEQLPLRGLARSVRPLEGDQQAAAFAWIGEMGAGGAAEGRWRRSHWG